MKAKIIYIILLFLLQFSCINHNKENKKDRENEVSVFIGKSYPFIETKIKVWVNDSIIYDGQLIYGYKSNIYEEMLVGKIKKTVTPEKFKVQISDRDTTFYYKISNIDSIAIGLFYDSKYFYVRDDSIKAYWMVD